MSDISTGKQSNRKDAIEDDKGTEYYFVECPVEARLSEGIEHGAVGVAPLKLSNSYGRQHDRHQKSESDQGRMGLMKFPHHEMHF